MAVYFLVTALTFAAYADLGSEKMAALRCLRPLVDGPIFQLSNLWHETPSWRVMVRKGEYIRAEDKVAYISKVLKEENIGFENKKFYLVISKSGESRFNRLAKATFKQYGADLIFDPLEVDLIETLGRTKGNNIFLPISELLAGAPDLITFHEVKHIAKLSKFLVSSINRVPDLDKTSLDTGLLQKPREQQWPWGDVALDPIEGIYVDEVGLDEISTWGQSIDYIIRRSVFDPAYKDSKTLGQAERVLKGFLKYIKYAKLKVENSDFSVHKSTEDDEYEGLGFVLRQGDFRSRQVIPKKYWKAQLRAANAAFGSPKGQMIVTQAIELALDDLEKLINQYLFRANHFNETRQKFILTANRAKAIYFDRFIAQRLRQEGWNEEDIQLRKEEFMNETLNHAPDDFRDDYEYEIGALSMTTMRF